MEVVSGPGPQCQPITFPARPEFQGSPAKTTEDAKHRGSRLGGVRIASKGQRPQRAPASLGNAKVVLELLQEFGHYKLGENLEAV